MSRFNIVIDSDSENFLFKENFFEFKGDFLPEVKFLFKEIFFKSKEIFLRGKNNLYLSFPSISVIFFASLTSCTAARSDCEGSF